MIKNVSVFGLILWALTAHASAATSCPNNNYIAYTLNDARVKAEKNWGAEDLENFDAMIDILVKDSPDCLAAAWSMLIPQVQKAIRLRASEHTDKSNCDVKIDIEDRSWCNPYFREKRSDCVELQKLLL